MHITSLIEQLRYLKTHYKILGVKAETEAEGSSFEDLYQLKILCTKVGLPLYIKIGGVEAVNDIVQAYKVGADGIIAPMVETEFALYKFLSAVDSVYKDQHVELTINIETKTAFDNIDSILSSANGRINQLNVGRTDLVSSYCDPNITTESTFIYGLIKALIAKATQYKSEVSFGGNVKKDSIRYTQNDPFLLGSLSKIETRKIMFSADSSPEIIDHIFKFEKNYLMYKKHIADIEINSSMNRLEQLKVRT